MGAVEDEERAFGTRTTAGASGFQSETSHARGDHQEEEMGVAHHRRRRREEVAGLAASEKGGTVCRKVYPATS